MSNDTNGSIDLQSLCDLLINEFQATYIAAPEQTLANQSPVLLFHVPVGSRPLAEVRDDIANELDGVDSVRVDDEKLPFSLRDVLHSDVHAFQRVPLYVDSQPGMDDVSLEEGMERAQKFVGSEIESDLSTSESIELSTLVEELADAGAAAVELRNEQFVQSGLINLRIPMIPAKGYQIAGPYESITYNGQSYAFHFECVLGGPGGYGTMRTPLYVDESIVGLSPLSVEEGLTYFDEIQSITEETDSPSDVYERLRDVVPTHG